MKNLIRFDWAMKKLLRDKPNYGVLEGFLTELLKFEISILQIGESEANQQNVEDKFNRVDILAHTLTNEVILIELQADSQLDYFHRMAYGVSKSITEHIKIGDNYGKIKKVYSVNIVYFHLGQGNDYVYHGKTEFRGLHTNYLLGLSKSQLDHYKIGAVHEIYPEYYILKINDFNDVAKDGLDEWIYFLKNNEVKDSFKAKGLDVVKAKLMVDQMNEVEREAYIRDMENKRNQSSTIETAIIQGEKQGKIELAKNALTLGLSISDISKLTGLTEDEINQFI